MPGKLKLMHPGEVLREEFLVPLKMSAGALAKVCGLPRTRIERIGSCSMSSSVRWGRATLTALMVGAFCAWRGIRAANHPGSMILGAVGPFLLNPKRMHTAVRTRLAAAKLPKRGLPSIHPPVNFCAKSYSGSRSNGTDAPSASLRCHPRESGDPVTPGAAEYWIPRFRGE
jgi:hypothetical protein